jgi:hypothetical protein
MNNDGCLGVIIAGLLMITTFIIGDFFGWQTATQTQQEKAIQADVGRWTIESNTGKRTFVYGCQKGLHLSPEAYLPSKTEPRMPDICQ